MSDIYDTPKRYEAELRRIAADTRIDVADRAAIVEFLKDGESRGLTAARLAKYGWILRRIAYEFGGPLSAGTEETVHAYVRRLEQSPRAAWTKHDYKVALKSFFRWLRKCEDGYPPEVKWIKSTVKKRDTKLPEDLLTEEEVQRIILAAGNLRDRALIQVLYEGGLRIGELLTMRVGNVQFIRDGARLMVRGKTGPRCILVVASVPAISNWLSIHPKASDAHAPLWPAENWSHHGGSIRYETFTARLRAYARRAGIAKRVHPHLFRHSRSSHVANRWTEAQMNAYFGWVQGSDMPRTYVHLSGRDMDNAVLGLYGMQRDDGGNVNKRLACPRCHADIATGSVTCPKCWLPLSARPAPTEQQTQAEWGQVEQVMERLLQNPEFLALLAKEKAREEAERRPPAAVLPRPGPPRAA